MLAAMSHDLRTPLNRLRLRAEFIADAKQQRKMFIDLEAMNVTIDSTLAFGRDDVGLEPRRLVDRSVLVGDVCEDAVDAGGTVSYFGPRGVNVRRMATLEIVRKRVIDSSEHVGDPVLLRTIQDLAHQLTR